MSGTSDKLGPRSDSLERAQSTSSTKGETARERGLRGVKISEHNHAVQHEQEQLTREELKQRTKEQIEQLTEEQQQQLKKIWSYTKTKLRENIQMRRMDPNRQGEPLNMVIKLPPDMQNILDKDPEIKKFYGDLTMNLALKEITKSIQEKKPLITSTEFSVLCDNTLEKMKTKLAERKINNPMKTDEEQNLGVYIEEIEPQVRDAVLEFNRKGYSTSSSGFDGKKKEYQSIAGFFTFDEKTKVKLKDINVEIIENKGWGGNIDEIIADDREVSAEWKGSTLIRFKLKEPNLEAMKKEWAKITELIPDKDESGLPSQTYQTPTGTGDRTPTGTGDRTPTGTGDRTPTEEERLAIQRFLAAQAERDRQNEQRRQANEDPAARLERERSYDKFWEHVKPQIRDSVMEELRHPKTIKDLYGNHRRDYQYKWNNEMREIQRQYPDIFAEIDIRAIDYAVEVSQVRSPGAWIHYMLSHRPEINDS